MAALTGDRDTPRRNSQDFGFGVATNTVIPAGALVALNASGFLVNGAEATGLVAVGRCTRGCNNNPGANGAKIAACEQGTFRWNNSASADLIAVDDVGKVCYIVDNQTVALTSNSNARSVAGVIVDVDAYGVWVKTEFGLKVT